MITGPTLKFGEYALEVLRRWLEGGSQSVIVGEPCNVSCPLDNVETVTLILVALFFKEVYIAMYNNYTWQYLYYCVDKV